MLMADDYGRGRAGPAAIAAGAWRYQLERDDGAHAAEVLARASRAMRELVEIRFVTLYTVSGQRYYAIRSWAKHQKVDHPGKPRVPEPPSEDTSTISDTSKVSRDSRETVARTPVESSSTLAPDLRSPTTTTTTTASEDHTRARDDDPPGPVTSETRRAEVARAYLAPIWRERTGAVPLELSALTPRAEVVAQLAGLPERPELDAVLARFFDDPKMREKGWPVAWFLRNPVQWSGRSAAKGGHAAARKATEYERESMSFDELMSRAEKEAARG